VGHTRRWIRATAVFSVGVALAIVESALPVSADGISSDNIDIYVLVDESSSLSERDTQLEREAVEGIVSLQTIKKRGIRVGVVPFSSGANSPRTIRECELKPVDDGNDLVLKDCARQIKRQFGQSGNTDFAGAFNYVADFVKNRGEEDRIPVIILLTDGIFDPDGDQKTADLEQQSLANSLKRLKEEKISIWSIGFGKADLAALTKYSSETVQPRESCDAFANARIVEKDNLSGQLLVVVGEATCVDVSPPGRTPSTRFIHPLIDTVVVTVVAEGSQEPVLVGPNQESLCADKFREINDRTFQCTISTDGSDSGNWTVTAGAGSEASWELLGNVLLGLDQCPNPTAVNISRVDGEVVNFESAVLWPEVELRIGDELLGTVSANRAEVPIANVVGALPRRGSLEVTAKESDESSGLPRLNVRATRCDLATPPTTTTTTTVPPTTTTTVPPATTVPPPPCDVTNTCPPPPPPYWLFVLMGLAVAVAIYGAVRYKQSRRFPDGTLISQRSPINEKAWIDPTGELGSDLSNQTKVVLSVDRNSKKVSVNPYGSVGDYVISTAKGQVVIEANIEEETPELDDATEGDEPAQLKQERVVRIEPFGIAFDLEPGIVIRIETPATDTESEIDNQAQ